MTIIHQLWQHTRTGEVFAVELAGARVTGACGPLDYLEQRADMLLHVPYDPDLGAEIDAAQHLYVLARPPREQRTTMQWNWKEVQRWLIHNRPGVGLANVGGVRGFYKLDEGVATSFVPCGFTWKDVAARLGAMGSRGK